MGVESWKNRVRVHATHGVRTLRPPAIIQRRELKHRIDLLLVHSHPAPIVTIPRNFTGACVPL